MKFNRRKFLKRAMILGGAGALTGLYAWQIEPFWLEFVHREMPIKNLPKNLEGRTLMQISDMHVGNMFDRQYLIDSLKEAQGLNLDLVVYTGDFVSYDSPEQFGQLEEVLKTAVLGRLGTVGILGNHDYGNDWAEPEVANKIAEICEQSGIMILRNESTSIEGLNIIGVDDYWGVNFELEKALLNYRENEANLALCHNPDVVDLEGWNNYKGWVLSGHTHGGQCKPPFLKPPMLPVTNKLYAAGEVDLKDGRTLYINRALGHLWQIRFNVRPEITVFKLTSA